MTSRPEAGLDLGIMTFKIILDPSFKIVLFGSEIVFMFKSTP